MTIHGLELSGVSLVAGQMPQRRGAEFRGMNPISGSPLDPFYYSATDADIENAAEFAASAFGVFSGLSGKRRAALLRRIAEILAERGSSIVDRANLETGLPLPRLQGELARTTGQLKLFAEVLEEGSWVNARIDEADRARKPIPRPDVRSMFRPLGPVAVFGASNFPLAFSVAGGDTVSALAAGNPVIVKAHPAHPGTSELVGQTMQEIYQITSALKALPFCKHVAVLTDARFSGVSTGACVGHISPEALAGGPVGRVRDGDTIEIVIDRNVMQGTINLVGEGDDAFSAEEGSRRLGQRSPRYDLRPHPDLPDDTRLWAALVQASGGVWGGCVYDVHAIVEQLDLGAATQKRN